MYRILLSQLLLLWSMAVFAQSKQSWEDYFNRMAQTEDVESEDWEQTYEVLSGIAANKLDLNRCTREDLEQLPFLSAQQIMDIMEYRDRAQRIETPIELRMIPSLERREVDMLMQFVEIRPELSRDTIPSLKNILKYGKHELVGMLKIPFYDRKGDKNGYLGYKYKHWLRYTFSSGRHIKAGLVASQDAGEPFFAGKNPAGYDFYSFYVMLKNVGRIKAVALGRYRLRFGMGLVLNNSFGLGKINTLSMLGRSGNNIFAHSSRLEANYLQGGAATIELVKGLDLTAFASWRKVDATLNKDSGTVATILKTGYHRTESEMRRRRNTSQTLVGGNLNYFNNGFHVGVSGLYTAFDRELRPNTTQRYRAWYPAGRRFWNVSIDYGYISNRLNVAGETATGDCGSVATINSISYQLTSNFSMMALQRYYPYQYTALFGQSFAEGGAVNNESGVYMGGNWTPKRGLNVAFYMDMAYFPWAKYQARESSHCFDNFLQIAYSRKRWDLLARYRLKMRQRDNADKSALNYRNEHRGRLAAAYHTGRWSSQTQADLSLCHFTTNSFGYMLSEALGYNHRRLRLHATIGYFNTDDYNARIYMYEKGLLYSFSFPSFFGEGLRYAFNVRAELGKSMMAIAKIGTTTYFDRQTIGSSLQEIKSKSMSDLELQLRLKL
ncbi:MAG: ComEA family DNA-binding protein [Prevotella sp.]|jgi:hypothetical protein